MILPGGPEKIKGPFTLSDEERCRAELELAKSERKKSIEWDDDRGKLPDVYEYIVEHKKRDWV